MDYDVAIIGGGPAGCTAGTLLKKYGPHLNVAIFEREVFPRDHIGESLLPPINRILHEMEVWDKVEAAGFPIKVGATYRWGQRPELWDFDFLPPKFFRDEERPARYEGQRQSTAFQVDRSIYDQVLIQHAASLGCDVRQPERVLRVHREGDRVTGLELASGEMVTARHYVDASGNSGILRRAMEIECDYPSTLRNIAIYDYWQNAEWAVEIGVGGTRIQILSVGYGWIWFIPLGPTRTSIGLVVPAEYYKASGRTPEELYREALREESIVAALTKGATSERKLQTTRDWSFLSDRQTGENWFLIGECAGFADPILSAGVTMAHIAGQQLAFTILELDRGTQDQAWLKGEFAHRQAQRIRTHIRFGDYWYTANEQFKELKEFTTTLAHEIGLELTPERAWDWIARGGFVDEELECGYAGFSMNAIRGMGDMLVARDDESPCNKYNVLQLNLEGATRKDRAEYQAGRVFPSECYVRGDKVLPFAGPFKWIVDLLRQTSDLTNLIEILQRSIRNGVPDASIHAQTYGTAITALEAMILGGWVTGSVNPNRPMHRFTHQSHTIAWNKDIEDRVRMLTTAPP